MGCAFEIPACSCSTLTSRFENRKVGFGWDVDDFSVSVVEAFDESVFEVGFCDGFSYDGVCFGYAACSDDFCFCFEFRCFLLCDSFLDSDLSVPFCLFEFSFSTEFFGVDFVVWPAPKEEGEENNDNQE